MSNILEMFEQHGALLRGHFLLSSGLHSDRYLQCALVLQHPAVAEELGRLIAQAFAGVAIDVVVGTALGGVVIGQEVGRALRTRAIFAEREGSRMTLRRGFTVAQGERALIVEDVVTTGGSAQEVLELLTGMGASVAGVGAIIDRSGGAAKFPVPFRALETLAIATHKPEACPLCAKGIPVVKPGSRK